jgi:hypothetical protein
MFSVRYEFLCSYRIPVVRDENIVQVGAACRRDTMSISGPDEHCLGHFCIYYFFFHNKKNVDFTYNFNINTNCLVQSFKLGTTNVCLLGVLVRRYNILKTVTRTL